MLKNCQQCNREFEGRADAKTCSPLCRQNAKRGIKVVTDKTIPLVTDTIVTDKVVTPVTDNVTDIKPGISATGLNYDWNEVSPILKMKKVPCKGCGEPVWEDLNPCFECSKIK